MPNLEVELSSPKTRRDKVQVWGSGPAEGLGSEREPCT
jgi:hypothetical protein